MSNEKYVRFGPTVNAKQHDLIPASKNIYDIIKANPNRDYYTSIYRYSTHHLKTFQETKSVAGITDVTTPKLVFDFDDKTNADNARKDAITICERLIAQGIPEDKLRLYFSGNKGVHVELITKQEFTRTEFVNMITNLGGDLATFDHKVKDEARIFRAPLSKHPVSGLYKTPLTFDELKDNSIESIKQIAKDVSDIDPDMLRDELYEIDLPEKILKLKDKGPAAPEKSVQSDLKFDTKDIDFSKCPKWMAKERYALQEGFFYGSDSTGKGERNSAFMILAATYKGQGFSADHALMLLTVAAEKQAKRTGESPWDEAKLNREIIKAVFSLTWKGGTYGKDEELLVITRNRFGLQEVPNFTPGLVKIEDVGERFKQFAEKFHENRIFTGIEALDEKIVLTASMAVGILGSPSSGKTTLLNKIVKYQSEHNIPTIYQSLDMSDNLLYLRLLQQYAKLPIEYIIEEFQNKTVSQKLLNAYNDVLKSYSNVHFNFRSAMTVEQIDKDIENYISQTGLNPKLVAVDYLEKIHTNTSDPTSSSGLAASQLSDLAKKYNCCVIVLLQPQKSAGDPSEPLLSMRKVKGASVIEQDLRCILTVWRPGFSPMTMADDRFLSMACVKNNMGELCQMDFGWNGVTGNISDLDDASRFELKQLRARLDAEKAKQNDF